MMMEDQLVLVTGASGFVGCHVIQQLQRAGYRVRGTVRSLKNEDKVAPLRKLVPDAKHELELVEVNLSNDRGWDDAVLNCYAVIHVASPMTPLMEGMPDESYFAPAVDGTLRILRAATKAGVTKVVMTGSFSAVAGDPIPWVDGKTYTEEDRTDSDFPNLEFYTKSKTLSEKAAWDFLRELPDDKKLDLTVILPTFIWGPPLLQSNKSATSMITMDYLLNHKIPGNPRLMSGFCDVRDVAGAHLRALTSPGAAGKRILVNSESAWIVDAANILAEEFRPQGYWIYTNNLPYFFIWIASFFDRRMGDTGLLDKIGKSIYVSNKRMVEILGMTPIPFKKTVLDMAYAMIDIGITFKGKNYKKVEDRSYSSA